jgi:hypothetical protein
LGLLRLFCTLLNKFSFFSKNIIHNYDAVIGPIADDGVALQIGLFKDGYINLTTLAETLKYRKLNNQYYFGTPKAIKLLRRL